MSAVFLITLFTPTQARCCSRCRCTQRSTGRDRWCSRRGHGRSSRGRPCCRTKWSGSPRSPSCRTLGRRATGTRSGCSPTHGSPCRTCSQSGDRVPGAGVAHTGIRGEHRVREAGTVAGAIVRAGRALAGGSLVAVEALAGARAAVADAGVGALHVVLLQRAARVRGPVVRTRGLGANRGTGAVGSGGLVCGPGSARVLDGLDVPAHAARARAEGAVGARPRGGPVAQGCGLSLVFIEGVAPVQDVLLRALVVAGADVRAVARAVAAARVRALGRHRGRQEREGDDGELHLGENGKKWVV